MGCQEEEADMVRSQVVSSRGCRHQSTPQTHGHSHADDRSRQHTHTHTKVDESKRQQKHEATTERGKRKKTKDDRSEMPGVARGACKKSGAQRPGKQPEKERAREEKKKQRREHASLAHVPRTRDARKKEKRRKWGSEETNEGVRWTNGTNGSARPRRRNSNAPARSAPGVLTLRIPLVPDSPPPPAFFFFFFFFFLS